MSLLVSEDTPPDMLAGSMDLKVVLPDGQCVRMSVHRGTPMMDLLVQVTTAHCLTPGDYSLQPMGDRGVLPFKPSTPIGALDTFTVKIVEKKLSLHSRGRAAQVPQSFLNTFRLQVHLPRSQLFVLRVTPDVTLSEIMTHICTEKNLSMEKYEFRNPGNLDEVLELNKTLGDYKLQALSMMSKGNRTVTGLMSSADIINVKSSKQRQNSVCDSSLSSGSFGSRSGSPIPPIPPMISPVVTMPPQPPMRKKRRPAPKPPSFTEKEKKDQTTDSVLISHSRESSDSSGYHEASVLSESPVHGSPAGRIDSDSPPDTLPRRAKLPPSQSFTNLTSIHPPPKNRLTPSVSNTSLNSNGFFRKKRAPPPPPAAHHEKDNKVKSSTLPTSVTEERRNATSLRQPPPVEVSHVKVQSPVETKAKIEEVPGCLDVDVRHPPKPKPRTWIPKTPREEQTSAVSVDLGGVGSLNRWKNLENLAEEEAKQAADTTNAPEKRIDGGDCAKSGLVAESSEPPSEESAPDESQDLADHDSINWEYQLPPPPTDFRDSSSPTCTEFGTVTITPEVLENVGERAKAEPQSNGSCAETKECKECPEKETEIRSDKTFSQNKSAVMNEVTNILNGKHSQQRFKEKSLSISNLYINESTLKDYRKNGLNYSRSFSTEVAPSLNSFKLATHQTNNKNLSASNEVIRSCGEDDVTYNNNRNLEKSSSMECVRPHNAGNSRIIERTEDMFRKPVAPVQKKLKVAKRSVSSAGSNKRTSLDVAPNPHWEDDENIHILREQFLEFLKEKKLSRDLNAKSLDVIRNILPELSQADNEARHAPLNLLITETTREANPKDHREKEEDANKRYSYQGPPSINFATWGERPKITKIVIKDEDYVTREKVTEKSEQVSRSEAPASQKPKEVPKRPIVLKKPGVLSRYEMFSALPRRKEVSSRELVQMEDEERKRTGGRVPVVCGMELKKEAVPPAKAAEPPVQPEVRPKHSVSVYVNGAPEVERSALLPKRNSVLMPVVKGFRCVEEKSGGREEGMEVGVGVSVVRVKGGAGRGASGRKVVSGDARGDLLEEIRNFGGLRKLKRTGVH